MGFCYQDIYGWLWSYSARAVLTNIAGTMLTRAARLPSRPQHGLAMLRSVRAGACYQRPGHWSPGLGGCQSWPLVSEYDAASWPPRLLSALAWCVSLGCVYGEARGRMGHRMQASLVTAVSPAISRRRPRLGTKLRPRVNNKQININSATLSRLPPRRHH